MLFENDVIFFDCYCRSCNMNEELAEVKNHAELIVHDLLRRTITLYDKELSTSDKPTPKMDNIGDQTIFIERNVGDSKQTVDVNDNTNNDHVDVCNGINSPEFSTRVGVDPMSTVNIIENVHADTTTLCDTLKLFNKHQPLPSIPERTDDEK